jgi:hypothetical protein
MTDEQIVDAAMDGEYSDAPGALRVAVEALLGFDSHGLSKQHELLLFWALDACLGALHHIGRDDVVDELCDERPLPEAAK